MPGTLFVVATPIGNLEDISARALGVLRRVAVIAAEDTRRTSKLLNHYGIETPTTSLHAHNERQKAQSLVARLSAGDDVALVSDAGTPTVSDPGGHLIRLAIDAGIRVEAVPGPSAILAALAASGLPTDTFTFLGFPPPKGSARTRWFDQISKAGRTAVFFEAPHRIIRTLEDLLRTAGDRQISVGRELTKVHEELVRGPISRVLETPMKALGEFTVVVDIGRTTETDRQERPSDNEIAAEFGLKTESAGISRRSAIGTLAQKYGLTINEVYAAVERSRKSGK